MQDVKRYYRIMLGRKSIYAKEAKEGGYIGGGWIHDADLTHDLSDNWQEFNQKYIPIYLASNPDKTKISAGLACGMLYTIAKAILVGDIVLSPDGQGRYFVGQVTGEYEYYPGTTLPHRRNVSWFSRSIPRENMSLALRNSTGSIATVSNISKYATEIETLMFGNAPLEAVVLESVESASEFALEKHLEDFLVQNWDSTDLGKRFDIYEEEGEIIGQQYPSDTGPIDILAVSKDKKEIVVIELKRGRASDVVVGQIQRYMGYVKEKLAEADQKVIGVIVAFEDDLKVRRALSVTNNIEFYTYKVSFKLEKK